MELHYYRKLVSKEPIKEIRTREAAEEPKAVVEAEAEKKVCFKYMI